MNDAQVKLLSWFAERKRKRHSPRPLLPLETGEQTVNTRVDAPVDYAETARIADEAFSSPETFAPDHMQWLYERCFSDGATEQGITGRLIDFASAFTIPNSPTASSARLVPT